jgi:hypothetical protein
MRFRKLRIAWSVVFGIACVLLMVLWARSYWWSDRCDGSLLNHGFKIDSREGNLTAIVYDQLLWGITPWQRVSFWLADLEEAALVITVNQPIPTYSLLGIEYGPNAWGGWLLIMPHWFFSVILGVTAALPWIRHVKWRFGLRTLLIATTLVAVVLGLIVAVL